MDKVRPYLFYIVCGVVLIALVVLMVVVQPSDPEAPGATVEDTKQQADQAYRQKLKKSEPPLGLELRAQKTLERGGGLVPENPRKPEDPAHVSEILDNYIIHASWNGYFQAVVEDYRQQLAGIQKTLVGRSEALGEPVSPSSDPGQWYQAYLEQSVGLLAQAIESGVMIEPPKPGAAQPAGGGFGGGGFGGQPTPAATTPEPLAWTRTQLEEHAPLRQVVGLYTASGQFPPPGEHPQLTTRLHIIERVIEALIRAEAMAEPNPNLQPQEGQSISVPQPRQARKAKVVGLTWGESRPASLRGGQYHRFDLRLRGTPSALLAALARLDSVTTPIAVRLGAQWSLPQQSGFGAAATRTGGDAAARADSVMEVAVGFVVVDFRGLEGVDLAATEAAPGAPVQPGMPMAPEGF